MGGHATIGGGSHSRKLVVLGILDDISSLIPHLINA